MEASGAPSFLRILHCRIWPCCALLVAVLLSAGTFSARAHAQEERPQIIPGERKAPRKKDAGPRAVAVLQMGADGKASLVPIAILINGKFWDATAYKADPVPMALDSGTVYEAEQTGSSLGLFTVSSALHRNPDNADHVFNVQPPWLGTGIWRPAGMEEPTKAMHAESAPVGIDTTDQPPRLTHDTSKKDTPASTAPKADSTPSASSAPRSGSSGGSSDSGDGPPRLTKPPSDSPPASTPAGGSQSTPGSPAPTQGDPKSKDAKADQASVPASDSGAGEANRPRLRREKPAESFADEDVPGYSKLGSTPVASGAKVDSTSAKSDVKLIPAISDAGGPPPHSFKFEWLKGDEDDRRKQIVDLAKEQVKAYIAARAKAKIVPKPAHSVAARRPAAPEPVLENIQMIAYDLWNSNQAIIVFSAQAHLPPPPAGTAHSEVDSEVEYSILLVAYPDIYNNLRKIYSGITDKFHLDVTPRLDLVDAVDADGDGRGELLFRETTDAGNGWMIYRVTADKLWKMFDSLSPE
jgi:hypothetical protein